MTSRRCGASSAQRPAAISLFSWNVGRSSEGTETFEGGRSGVETVPWEISNSMRLRTRPIFCAPTSELRQVEGFSEQRNRGGSQPYSTNLSLTLILTPRFQKDFGCFPPAQIFPGQLICPVCVSGFVSLSESNLSPTPDFTLLQGKRNLEKAR